MANLFDIISSPQYEKSGRFNALALPELIYGFTPSGRKEIDRNKSLKRRSQDAGVSQQEAGLSQTRSETAGIDARTAGQEGVNSAQKFNYDQAREQAVRNKAARFALPSPAPGVPGEMAPEYTQFMAPVQQYQQGEETFKTQQELARLGLGETRGLVNQGVPITQPGQAAASRTAATQASSANIASEDQRAKQAAATHVLNQAQMFGGPGVMEAAGKFLQQLGYPVLNFQQPTNDAAGIDAELQRRKSAPPAAPQAQPQTPPQSRNPLMAPQPQVQQAEQFPQFGRVLPATLPGFAELPPQFQEEVRRTVAENPSFSLERVKEIIQFLMNERGR